MIKIYKETQFKVLKPEAFNLDRGVCGYSLWENTVLDNPTFVHSKGFGQGYYGPYASVWAGFDTVTHKLRVYCNSFEDMTWLNFNENELEKITDKDDLECIYYTIKFLRKLANKGIIELDTGVEE